MAWTAPRTWTVGQILTAAQLNTDVRDNMLYLAGSTGLGGVIGLHLLASGTVAGTVAANIDLTSISGSYRNLQLQLLGRGDRVATSDSVLLRLNNDSGSNYDRQRSDALNTTLAGAESIGGTSIYVGEIAAASAPAGGAGVLVIDLPGYAQTTFHKALVARSTAKLANSSSGVYLNMQGGHWRNTAAVSRITLLPSSGNFEIGTTYALYGLL